MFDRVGGAPFFDALTSRFYEGVAAEPVLAALYPTDDAEAFEASRCWLRDFLIQYWGGPTTYSDERGHPRLRMRHAPFAIGATERDAWLTRMTAAVKEAGLSGLDEVQMLTYFEATANHMVNQPG
jgi:hemoglobin